MAAITLADEVVETSVTTPPINDFPSAIGGLARSDRLFPTKSRSVTLPLVRSGGVEWRVTAGTPTVRSIEIRNPSLFSVDFTTSRYALLSDHLGTLLVREALADGSRSGANHASSLDALVTSQRPLADARLHLLSVEDRHCVRRADRSELEAAKQAVVVAAADHDEAVHDFLASFGAAHLSTPDGPRAHALVSENERIVGYLIRTAESLQPALLASAANAPFDSVGRTTFLLTDPSTGVELPTGWISTSDGTTVLVYQRAGSGPVDRTTLNGELAVVALDDDPIELTATFVRHHGDDSGDGDHRLDRSYLLARSSSEPEIVSGLPLQVYGRGR